MPDDTLHTGLWRWTKGNPCPSGASTLALRPAHLSGQIRLPWQKEPCGRRCGRVRSRRAWGPGGLAGARCGGHPASHPGGEPSPQLGCWYHPGSKDRARSCLPTGTGPGPAPAPISRLTVSLPASGPEGRVAGLASALCSLRICLGHPRLRVRARFSGEKVLSALLTSHSGRGVGAPRLVLVMPWSLKGPPVGFSTTGLLAHF